MNRAVVKGRVEELVKKAFSCLERGEVEAAAEILDKSRVDVLFKERMHDRMEELRRDAETAVQTYSYIIQIQKLLGESVKTAETIISCYEEIMGYLRELPSLDCRPALEYALFLDSQNAQRAEQIFREAEYLYQKPDRRRQEDDLAELYLGIYFLGLPFLFLGSKLSGKRPLYTAAALASLKERTDFPIGKAKREFGFSPRPLKETVRDHVQFLIEEGMVNV